MKKIVVGLPTYNEAENIERASTLIDEGLLSIPNIEGLIINADNNSPDNTSSIFKNLQLKTPKVALINQTLGKGVNILSILKYAQKVKADAVIFLDADVISLQESWIKSMSDDLLHDQVDAIFPSYQRSRFDGTATNHLVIPVLTAMTGKLVSQPIGGKFAFSGKIIDKLISQITKEAYGYGIDVCLTSTVLSEEIRYKECWLSEKIHSPGQNKISQLFIEVFTALFTFLPDLQPYDRELPQINVVTHKADVLTKERKEKFMNEMHKAIDSLQTKALSLINQKDLITPMDEKCWVLILAEVIKMVRGNLGCIDTLRKELLPLFLNRNLTFWEEIENLAPEEVEQRIVNQALALRKHLLSEHLF